MTAAAGTEDAMPGGTRPLSRAVDCALEAPAARRVSRHPARLLVAVDLPRLVHGVAVRRVHRQRPVDRRPFRRRPVFPGAKSDPETRSSGDAFFLDRGLTHRDPEAQKLIEDKGWMRAAVDPVRATTRSTTACRARHPRRRHGSTGSAPTDQGRDDGAAAFYGFRISALVVRAGPSTLASSVIGAAAGAVQG